MIFTQNKTLFVKSIPKDFSLCTENNATCFSGFSVKNYDNFLKVVTRVTLCYSHQ